HLRRQPPRHKLRPGALRHALQRKPLRPAVASHRYGRRTEVCMIAVRSHTARPSAVSVAMPDGSTHLLTKLLSHANHNQAKGAGFLSVGLTLTPRATGRAGRTFCSFATRGCAAACFADYNRLAWPRNKRVAVARTRLLAQSPEIFLAMLSHEL